jgi:hypothetical protein
MTQEYKIEKTKFKLEALYKEYGTRTQEIEFHSGRYHRITGYVQTYLAALSSLGTYIYLTESEIFEKAAKSTTALFHFEIITVLAFLTVFLFFLQSAMMDALYMLMINGNRVGVIEKKINETIETSAMEWENKVIPFALTDQWWVANGSVRPQLFVFVSTFILFVFAIGVLCFFASKYAFTYLGYYSVPTVLFGTFFLWQWVQLSMVGSVYLKNSIFHLFDLENLKEWDTDPIRYLIAPLTVFLGFGVFAMLSLQTDTFFPTKEHPFGFLAIPSIFMGDLLILPFLNRAIYDVWHIYRKSGYFFGFKFYGLVGAVGVVSFSLMGFIHYVWTQDVYTGFMDKELGILSGAGWWHFIFSSVELTAIIMTVLGGVFAYRDKNQLLYQTFLKFTTWLFLFTLIAVVDFIAKIFIKFFIWLGYSIYDVMALGIFKIFYEVLHQFSLEWFSFLPLIFSITLLRWAKNLKEKQ